MAAQKILGITSDDPEYWGLREVLTPEMCDVANKMKLRKYYTLEELIKKNPAVTSFFERMTFIPLAGITQMVPPGGDGIVMHMIDQVERVAEENRVDRVSRIRMEIG